MKRTCGSVHSSLSAPAWLATAGSEAAETISSASFFCFCEGDDREEVSLTTSVNVVRGLGWMTSPTQVNRRTHR